MEEKTWTESEEKKKSDRKQGWFNIQFVMFIDQRGGLFMILKKCVDTSFFI